VNTHEADVFKYAIKSVARNIGYSRLYQYAINKHIFLCSLALLPWHTAHEDSMHRGSHHDTVCARYANVVFPKGMQVEVAFHIRDCRVSLINTLYNEIIKYYLKLGVT